MRSGAEPPAAAGLLDRLDPGGQEATGDRQVGEGVKRGRRAANRAAGAVDLDLRHRERIAENWIGVESAVNWMA
jgi:hypothetical protein